jgi:hypothetical protein
MLSTIPYCICSQITHKGADMKFNNFSVLKV